MRTSSVSRSGGGRGIWIAIAGFLAVVGCGGDDSTGPDRCATTNAPGIAIGQSMSGSLATSDCKLADSTYRDLYKLTVTTSTTVRIDLTSTAFDAYLLLRDANGTTLDEDDDGGTSGNAMLIATLAPGTYYIVANSAVAGQTGGYTLSVTVTNPACTMSNAVATTLGATVNGTLATSDCILPSDGTYADVYRLTLATNRAIQVDLASSAFDAYLVLIDANGTVVAEDDDSAGGSNARIVTGTLAAGTYYVVANSFAIGETGAYTLTIAP